MGTVECGRWGYTKQKYNNTKGGGDDSVDVDFLDGIDGICFAFLNYEPISLGLEASGGGGGGDTGGDGGGDDDDVDPEQMVILLMVIRLTMAALVIILQMNCWQLTINIDDMLIIRNVDDVLIILRSVSALFAWGWSVSSGVGSPLLFTIGVAPSYQNASSSPSSLFQIIWPPS